MDVMIVDSNSQALEQTAKRLTSHQAALTLFLYSNAREALKFAIYHPVDVVYTRQTLGEMSGINMVFELLRFHPDVRCHVLQDGEDIPLFPAQSRSPPYGAAAGAV